MVSFCLKARWPVESIQYMVDIPVGAVTISSAIEDFILTWHLLSTYYVPVALKSIISNKTHNKPVRKICCRWEVDTLRSSFSCLSHQRMRGRAWIRIWVWLLVQCLHHCTALLFFFFLILTLRTFFSLLFRERGREKGIEKHRCMQKRSINQLLLICTQIGVWTCNLDMYPNWELNLQPFD